MAITKLMHMKEALNRLPSFHLKNSIDYILDVKHFGKKTGYGMWVGGNVGVHAKDVYNNFMLTKELYQKIHGRQGYHFVISFPPEEADEQKAYDVAKEFCEKYFGDDYEYVYAVHNDQRHKHAHIIFNSVSRTSGMKYRYEKGDWEKNIQPITDAICEKNGLTKLEIEKEELEPRSHSKWVDNKDDNIRWYHIVRADIDYAIEHTDSLEDFYEFMKKMNYTMRFGNSKKHGSYITYSLDRENEKPYKIRSYSKYLGENYSLDSIDRRIKNKVLEEPYYNKLQEKMIRKLESKLGSVSTLRGNKTYYRAYQAVSFYKLPNPFAVPLYKVKRDMASLDALIAECAYIKEHPDIKSYTKKKEEVQRNLKILYKELDYLKDIKETFKDSVSEADAHRYAQLVDLLSNAEEWNDKLEYAQDELEELKETLPISFIQVEEKIKKCTSNIEVLKNDKKMITHILRTEKGEAGENIFIRPNVDIKV